MPEIVNFIVKPIKLIHDALICFLVIDVFLFLIYITWVRRKEEGRGGE